MVLKSDGLESTSASSSSCRGNLSSPSDGELETVVRQLSQGHVQASLNCASDLKAQLSQRDRKLSAALRWLEVSELRRKSVEQEQKRRWQAGCTCGAASSSAAPRAVSIGQESSVNARNGNGSTTRRFSAPQDALRARVADLEVHAAQQQKTAADAASAAFSAATEARAAAAELQQARQQLAREGGSNVATGVVGAVGGAVGIRELTIDEQRPDATTSGSAFTLSTSTLSQSQLDADAGAGRARAADGKDEEEGGWIGSWQRMLESWQVG